MWNSSGQSATFEAVPLPSRSDMVDENGPRRTRTSALRAWWPVFAGVIVIALESTTFGGSDHTSGPLRQLYQFFFGPISPEQWEPIHHIIRKCGHFVGYGALCLTWLRAWVLSTPRFRFITHAALALLGTALIASCDEYHQSFLPNRGSSPWDVLLDCCGGAVMTLLAWLVLRWVRPELVGAVREPSN